MNFYIQQGSIYEASTSPSFNMLSSLMFLVILKGFSCEELTPVKTEENSVEDTTVTLSYNYSKQTTDIDYFYWYRQYSGKPPAFLISHLGKGRILNNPVSGLMIKVDGNQITLNISSAAVSDSAVYYCAVRPAGSVNKILFGAGTSLTIETKTVSEPSFYKLSGYNTSACLASDFSRIKAAEEQHAIFNGSTAVRSGDTSLYNQLVLLTPEEEEACEQAEDDSDVCGEAVEPDGRVNLMSVTMLGLRLLFFKTVVFNVLMTLRLWISQ